jgi:transcriptional regulator with XRE-family HTH domain
MREGDRGVPMPLPANYNVIGQRIQRVRLMKGLSRRDLAMLVGVDVSALANWERGKYLPRDSHKGALAKALDLTVERLFRAIEGDPEAIAASLLDTFMELPALFDRLLPNTRCLRALRLAAPYSSAAYVQTKFRAQVSERLLAGTLEVQRIEIFYTLERLKEALSNVIRYDSRPYHLKGYCAGLAEVAPAMGGYLFDDTNFVMGAYWTGVPPHNKPGLHCWGEPFRTFYMSYWNEIWPRGTLLNMSGAHDLSAIRRTAAVLGLNDAEWPAFVEQARTMEIGDGAPPLF